MTGKTMNRREFVARSASAAAAVALGPMVVPKSVFGANDRIRLGMVGPGSRGRHLMNWAHGFEESENAKFVAVCDIWNQRRERAAATVKEWTGKEPWVCRTLADICALEDVDALIIATADFQHAPHLAFAVQAGKDVYVEKPLGCDFDQIKKARDAVRATGRVVQLGTQRRGEGKYWGARDFVKSGTLGKITYGEISEPIFQERWRIRDAETSLTEADTDWKEFQSYTYDPKKPFDPRHYREFRIFWPYSTGCFCQWMSHAIDVVNLALDELPKAVVAHGGVFLWKDGRINPDTVQALVEYPSGCMVSYHMRMGNKGLDNQERGTFLYGTCGTMKLHEGKAYGDGGAGRVVCDDPSAPNPSFHVEGEGKLTDVIEWEKHPNVDQMQHWLQSIRTREKTRADAEAGFAHALATTMAGMSCRSGRRAEYDPVKDEVRLV